MTGLVGGKITKKNWNGKLFRYFLLSYKAKVVSLQTKCGYRVWTSVCFGEMATPYRDLKTFSDVLRDLEQCGFIRKYMAIGKKSRSAFYQLMDNYSLFYLNFVKANSENDEHFWTNSIDTPLRNSWSGIAFERLCLWHVTQIKAALGISGVNSSVYSWRTEATEEHDGAQIDLLIDRRDGVINLCEMKYADDTYALDAEEEKKLRNRLTAFKLDTKTRKGIHTTLVTTYGIRRNSHSGMIQSVVTMDSLFAIPA